MTDTLKLKWRNWLEKVSESNKQQFGSSVPDCCRLLNGHERGGKHQPAGRDSS